MSKDRTGKKKHVKQQKRKLMKAKRRVDILMKRLALKRKEAASG